MTPWWSFKWLCIWNVMRDVSSSRCSSPPELHLGDRCSGPQRGKLYIKPGTPIQDTHKVRQDEETKVTGGGSIYLMNVNLIKNFQLRGCEYDGSHVVLMNTVNMAPLEGSVTTLRGRWDNETHVRLMRDTQSQERNKRQRQKVKQTMKLQRRTFQNKTENGANDHIQKCTNCSIL